MHVREKRINKFIALFFALLILFSAVCSATINYTGYADDNPYPFDQTNVLEDLESSKDFNLLEWVWDYSGIFKTPMVMNFVEWCYSPFVKGDFALYIYFYNPSNLNIDVDNYSNRVQMASAYSGSGIITRESTPTDYDTYNIMYCNKSVRQNYEGMFYKFRVVDKKGADGLTLAERVYSGERRYDISGLVLATEDGAVREIGVGGTYYFSGYAAGYGPDANADNTLKCTGFQPLETISLEVHNTLYRQDGYSELGEGHRWDINSVYFSVPERYFKDYGALQKIKAEWWEYETEPILATTNGEAAAAFKEYLGVNIGNREDALKYGFTERLTYNDGTYTNVYYQGYTYNCVPDDAIIEKNGDKAFKRINTLHYAFNVDSLTDSTIVSADRLTNHIKSYDKSAVKGYLPVLIDGKKISADLFKTELSESRVEVPYTGDNEHHKTVTIDAGDTFDLETYNPVGDTIWNKLWVGLFGREQVSFVEDRSPIHTNVGDYIDGSNKTLSEALFISPLVEDMEEFRNFYNSAKEKDERTVVFNFAKTDYYEEKQQIRNMTAGNNAGVNSNTTALISTQSVFLDFKIIHLTFQKDGAFTVIPVTQDPINIINGVSGGAQHKQTDWEKGMENFFKSIGSVGIVLLYVVVAVLVIVILVKVVPFIKGICGGKVWLFILLTILLIAGSLIGMAFLGNWLYGFIANMGSLL